MQYEFFYIDAILRELKFKKTISEGYLRMRREELETRTFEIKTRFISNACSGNSKHTLIQYFRMHQIALTQIIDSFSFEVGDRKDLKTSTIKKTLSENAYTHCLELMDFMIHTFSSYLDNRCPLPKQISKSQKGLLLERLSKIGSSVSSELTVELHKICVNKLTLKEYSWSISSIDQWESLTQSLEDTHGVFVKSFEGMVSLFICHGFNSIKIYHQVCYHLDSQLKTINDPLEQQQYLFHLQKTFEQASIFASKSFFKGRPKLGIALISYIETELKLIDHLMDAGYGNADKDPFLGSFTVSLSVRQFAFFVFLQVETGILLTRTAKQVHQYFASRFSTIEGGTISEKSFKNAYYSHASEDIKKVIEKLSQMWVIAEETY
ncbi:hypothetical protein ABIB40_001493 [Pedobacter sp. UYP30]|uniref:hypothetical protein n=1 Tax=Pedobacter sp. UYP30 TaxID=1756400 RepID=UPI003399E912